MISLLLALLVLFETSSFFFPVLWNISNTQCSGISLYWAFLRNPHYSRKQSAEVVQEEIRSPDKVSLHGSFKKVLLYSKHQVLLPIHSRYITPWLSPAFWIMHHLCRTAWRGVFIQLPENLARCTVKHTFFYMLSSPNMFTKKRTVQPATGIDLTQLQFHTALTLLLWKRRKKK